jgi:serine/threonine-protein kinase
MASESTRDHRRLSALLDELLELDDAARAARRAAIGRESPGLGRELDRLLEAAESGPLARPVIELAGSLFAAPAGERGEIAERIGERVGPFRLTAELGRGGMGAVYAAERIDGGFEQRVAVKLVQLGLAGEDTLRRFARERQILARLAHPHIARLLEGGLTGRGEPWFALELVEGRPLVAWAQERSLPARERVRLFLDVCEAVAFAHRNLIVHRDLKPSNVLVDGAGEVKLLDFGIAKLLTEDDAEGLTRTSVPGPLTPAYASPEQLAGAPVTTLADVFQLGRVLEELLTGERPSARLGANPGLRARAGVELERIVARARHEDPARRYPSAEALAEDLRRHLDGRPVAARGDSLGYRATKFVRRHRVGLAAAAIALTALVGGLATALWQARVARREAARATAVRDFLVGMFKAASPAEAQGGDPRASEILARAPAKVERELAANPALAADLLEVIAGIETDLGRYPEAEALNRRAIELHRRVLPVDEAAIAGDLASIADMQLEDGEFDAADRSIRESLDLERRISGRETDRLAVALGIEGSLRARQGRVEEAEADLRRAARIFRATLGENDSHYYDELNSLGVLLQNQGRYADAVTIHRELLGWTLRNRGPEHPEIATDYHNLGTVLDRLDQDEEAERYLRQAVAVRRKKLPPGHEFTLASERNLATLLVEDGRWAEAGEWLDAAWAAYVDAGGTGSAGAASVRRIRARLESLRGDLAAARRDQEAAVEGLRAVYGARHARTARAEAELAGIDLELGDATAASVLAESALATLRQARGKKSDLACALEGLARVRAASGALDEKTRAPARWQ